MFLGVDWGAFVVVFLVALAATAVVVLFFSAGLRLLANGELETGAVDANGFPVGEGSTPVTDRSPTRTAGGWACIGVGGLAVLYALYLIIPQFH
ncbi:hypothetical protein EDF46_1154 [Frondihabitans sp. PhB188]|uniref:hypothetical protein n=1 Tax=Frondihabitans sp. PhB188 TaxID=2485200 RepID=UPI000F4AB364|nr:hypothetical protein [Frondihabitans sp. PhB188]ROQ39522.1 hypothetical protein EDF46_1154 [Frondihabitans sp. PhB188]